MAKVLVPPPVAKSDEILAASGGMFYGRESPGAPLFVRGRAIISKPVTRCTSSKS
jgi:hypothetical protein